MYTHLLDKFKEKEGKSASGLLKNTLLMVALLLDRQTVCLWRLKGSVGKFLGNTSTDSRSHYQRIKRWFGQSLEEKYVWLKILQYSVALVEKATHLLILDGTSWKWGGRTYHFLTLSILYRGVAIPIWWLELGRLGISNQGQRKVLLLGALKVFQLAGKVLIGDREYIGSEWFKTLKSQQIDFVIRLRAGNYQAAIEAGGKSLVKLERKVIKRVGRIVAQAFQLEGQTYYLVLTSYKNRQGKIELLRLITTLEKASKAVEFYQLRYGIEPLFKHLKSNGFDLEALHLQSSRKVRLLMALLVLAYTLAVVYGLKGYKRKYPPLKHGFPPMSVFKVGIEKWQNHLASFELFLEKALKCFNHASKPKNNPLLLNVP